MQTLQPLVEAIEILEEESDVDFAEYLTDGCEDDLPHEVREIVSLANDLLIGASGRPTRLLEAGKAGVMVRPGEVDSYGWLSGIIITKKGKIVFG